MAMIRKIGSNKCLCGVDRRLKRDKMNRGVMKCVEVVKWEMLTFSFIVILQ